MGFESFLAKLYGLALLFNDDSKKKLLGNFCWDIMLLHQNPDPVPYATSKLIFLNMPAEVVIGQTQDVTHSDIIFPNGFVIFFGQDGSHTPTNEVG